MAMFATAFTCALLASCLLPVDGAEESTRPPETQRPDSPGVALVEDLTDNGRKKILLIGKTGTGNSSVCNVLCGLEHNAKVFPVSLKADSCTQNTTFTNAFFK